NSVLIARNVPAIPIEDSIVPIPRPSGQPGGAVMVFRDVTAQRRAERALRESEERYRFLLDVMPDLIFTANARGEWDFCNRLWCDYTGSAPESCLGSGWTAALHADDVARTTSSWAECVCTGRSYEAEYRLRASDGSFRWFLARAYPKCDQAGVILRWVGICTDVEDSKRTQTQLSQALKMEAVGRLAGGVAHEINNRLTVIIGYASALTGDVQRPDLLQVGLEQILSAAHRSAALTRQLLTISRHQVVYPRLLDLNAVFHDMKAVLRRLVGGDIVLRDALAPDLLPVR